MAFVLEYDTAPLPRVSELVEQLELIGYIPRDKTKRNFYIIYAQVLEVLMQHIIMRAKGSYPKSHSFRFLVREVNKVCGFDILGHLDDEQRESLENINLVQYRYIKEFKHLAKPGRRWLFNFRDSLLAICAELEIE